MKINGPEKVTIIGIIGVLKLFLYIWRENEIFACDML